MSFAGAARAQEAVATDAPPSPPSTVEAAAQDGLLLPLALTPKVGQVTAVGIGIGGYDGARKVPIASAVVEARIWGPISLRGGAEYSPTRQEARPTVGARVQLLRQEAHGVDGAISVFYRPEGFTEPEGEIETFVSLGRRIDRVSLIGNLVYGQDPEGNERDGEVRLGALYGKNKWAVGLDSRLRFAIGTQRSAAALAEPKLDLLAGPVGTVAIGPVAVLGEVGPSLVKMSNQTLFGVAAMAGVATVF